MRELRSWTYRTGMKLTSGDAILGSERSFTRAEVLQIARSAAGIVLGAVAIGLAATR